MQRTRRRIAVPVAASLLAIAATALTGCTSSGTGQASGTASGSKDTLTLAMSTDINGWDPSNLPSYQSWAAQAVYDYVFRCNAKGEAQPDIATSWNLSKDQKSLTLHLRNGMKFTDGTAVDSAAIKANIEYDAKQGGTGGRLYGAEVATPNASTAIITLPQPTPLIEFQLCGTAIDSPKAISGGTVKKAPVGSGPYSLSSTGTTTGSVYTFTKNDNFWDSKSFPYKKVVLKVITSATATLNALKTGEVQGSIIAQSSYKEAKASNLQILTLKDSETTRLLLTDHEGKTVPALGNLQVRQAMNMVFDKTAMAKSLYQGQAAPADQIFRPGSSAYIPGLKDPYKYDVSAAKALMAKAGYSKGFTLEIPYIQGTGTDALFPYITQQLAKINITVKQVTLSGPNEYTELLSGKYPAPLWPLGNYGESKQDIYDYVLQTGIWNVSHQPDATVAKYWNQILSGTPSEQATAEKAINQYTIDQAWFVPMVYLNSFYAHTSSISIPTSTDPAALQPQLWDFR